MLKKSSLIILFFPIMAIIAAQLSPSSFGTAAYGQSLLFNSSSGNDVIERYTHLSNQQLLDTADYYYYKNCLDTALVCYTLIINTSAKDTDSEQQKRIIEALNKSGIIYRHMCDYRKSYELLIQALDLCEKYHYDWYKLKIYTSIGNIYFRFNKYDMAKSYYAKALNLCTNSADSVVILNNIGSAEMGNGKLDSAYYFLDKSLKISKTANDVHLHTVLNTIASIYQKRRLCDSAFYYFRLSLNEARKNHKARFEAENLSSLSKLFFEDNKVDSALSYINLSNIIAKENNLLDILTKNYLSLSQIEESKGRIKNALSYFKMYADLKDSISDVEVFSDINQLQRLYEVSKTNEQIEQFRIEQRIKERTIRYQQIIQFLTISILLLVSGVLLYTFAKNRKLNRAYKILFEKNVEILELQEDLPEKYAKKRQRVPTDNIQNELLDKILAIMEETFIICDPKFSIDKLAELTQSNQKYVSQVINNTLKKNFRSFLNSYRIREAQRLFSELDTERYTIESVAIRVGFKSPSAFRTIFKEITGVSPTFYLKSIQEQNLR